MFVTIETHNKQKTARSFSRKRKSTSRQATPKRVRLSRLEGSDSSSESEGDSEVPDVLELPMIAGPVVEYRPKEGNSQ